MREPPATTRDFARLIRPALVTILRENFGPRTETGRLLDSRDAVRAPVALALAHLFREVVAIESRRRDARRRRSDSHANAASPISNGRFGGSMDLSPALGQFRLVTMGNSFHWMDSARARSTRSTIS